MVLLRGGASRRCPKNCQYRTSMRWKSSDRCPSYRNVGTFIEASARRPRWPESPHSHHFIILLFYIVIIHCIFPLYFYIVTIRQQEVGAWRTPRLLFFIFSDLQIYISCQNCKCHSHIINRETLVLPLAILITLPGGIFQHHPPLSGGGIALFPHYRQCPTGTRTRPATRYFFRYLTRPDSVLKIIR